MSGEERSEPKILPLRRKRPCPICGRPAVTEHRPFCSRRCADVDLGRWFGGAYRIETDEAPGNGARGNEEE